MEQEAAAKLVVAALEVTMAVDASEVRTVIGATQATEVDEVAAVTGSMVMVANLEEMLAKEGSVVKTAMGLTEMEAEPVTHTQQAQRGSDTVDCAPFRVAER